MHDVSGGFRGKTGGRTSSSLLCSSSSLLWRAKNTARLTTFHEPFSNISE